MIYWDPDPNLFIIPIWNRPINWYGLLFAFGFAAGLFFFQKVVERYLIEREDSPASIRPVLSWLSDQIVLYVVVGTVVGARLGHFLFYEHPAYYLKNPWEIVQVWNGGLSSHGAVVGIICAIALFSLRTRKRDPSFTWLRLLDFLTIPAACAAIFIRVGNFINQEILGTETNLPWAVVFGHPAGGEAAVSRHPVQLYEALFYSLVFLILWVGARRSSLLSVPGRMLGLLFVLVFGFRIFIEFFKLEQSNLITAGMWGTMGQWLSIPLVVVGLVLLFRRVRSNITLL